MFNANDSNPLSSNIHLESYRMRIDNIDVYDRDILTNYVTGATTFDRKGHLTHDSLHYDSINRTFLNASLPLRNLTFMAMIRNQVKYNNVMRFTDDTTIGDGLNKIMIVASPTPITNETKKVQYNLTNKTGHNLGGVILYKQVLRSVNF